MLYKRKDESSSKKLYNDTLTRSKLAEDTEIFNAKYLTFNELAIAASRQDAQAVFDCFDEYRGYFNNHAEATAQILDSINKEPTETQNNIFAILNAELLTQTHSYSEAIRVLMHEIVEKDGEKENISRVMDSIYEWRQGKKSAYFYLKDAICRKYNYASKTDENVNNKLLEIANKCGLGEYVNEGLKQEQEHKNTINTYINNAKEAFSALIEDAFNDMSLKDNYSVYTDKIQSLTNQYVQKCSDFFANTCDIDIIGQDDMMSIYEYYDNAQAKLQEALQNYENSVTSPSNNSSAPNYTSETHTLEVEKDSHSNNNLNNALSDTSSAKSSSPFYDSYDNNNDYASLANEYSGRLGITEQKLLDMMAQYKNQGLTDELIIQKFQQIFARDESNNNNNNVEDNFAKRIPEVKKALLAFTSLFDIESKEWTDLVCNGIHDAINHMRAIKEENNNQQQSKLEPEISKFIPQINLYIELADNPDNKHGNKLRITEIAKEYKNLHNELVMRDLVAYDDLKMQDFINLPIVSQKSIIEATQNKIPAFKSDKSSDDYLRSTADYFQDTSNVFDMAMKQKKAAGKADNAYQQITAVAPIVIVDKFLELFNTTIPTFPTLGGFYSNADIIKMNNHFISTIIKTMNDILVQTPFCQVIAPQMFAYVDYLENDIVVGSNSINTIQKQLLKYPAKIAALTKECQKAHETSTKCQFMSKNYNDAINLYQKTYNELNNLKSEQDNLEKSLNTKQPQIQFLTYLKMLLVEHFSDTNIPSNITASTHIKDAIKDTIEFKAMLFSNNVTNDYATILAKKQIDSISSFKYQSNGKTFNNYPKPQIEDIVNVYKTLILSANKLSLEELGFDQYKDYSTIIRKIHSLDNYVYQPLEINVNNNDVMQDIHIVEPKNDVKLSFLDQIKNNNKIKLNQAIDNKNNLIKEEIKPNDNTMNAKKSLLLQLQFRAPNDKKVDVKESQATRLEKYLKTMQNNIKSYLETHSNNDKFSIEENATSIKDIANTLGNKSIYIVELIDEINHCNFNNANDIKMDKQFANLNGVITNYFDHI